MTVYMGIDPGMKGAFAVMAETPAIYKMPEEECKEELQEILEDFIKTHPNGKVIIEKPIIVPMKGTKPCPKCKTRVPYTYMQKGIYRGLTNYGIIIGMLLTLRIPFEEVNGTTWKKHFSLQKQGKAGSIKLAKQLFPELIEEIGKDDNVAEAILLADYGRRQT